MELTFAIGLDVFADGLKRNDGLLYLELENLLYAENSNCDYGLSLLRDAVAAGCHADDTTVAYLSKQCLTRETLT